MVRKLGAFVAKEVREVLPATILFLTAGLLPLLCGRRLRITRGRHCFS